MVNKNYRTSIELKLTIESIRTLQTIAPLGSRKIRSAIDELIDLIEALILPKKLWSPKHNIRLESHQIEQLDKKAVVCVHVTNIQLGIERGRKKRKEQTITALEILNKQLVYFLDNVRLLRIR